MNSLVHRLLCNPLPITQTQIEETLGTGFRLLVRARRDSAIRAYRFNIPEKTYASVTAACAV